MSDTKPVEQRIEGIWDRLNAATDGPWRIEHTSQGNELVIVGKCLPEDEDDDLGVVARVPDMIEYANPEDAEFIAHSREDIPWLLEQLSSVPSQIEAAVKAERERTDDHLESAWTIIANASGGNWGRESKLWREAAAKWRDEVMPGLSERAAIRSRGEASK